MTRTVYLIHFLRTVIFLYIINYIFTAIERIILRIITAILQYRLSLFTARCFIAYYLKVLMSEYFFPTNSLLNIFFQKSSKKFFCFLSYLRLFRKNKIFSTFLLNYLIKLIQRQPEKRNFSIKKLIKQHS